MNGARTGASAVTEVVRGRGARQGEDRLAVEAPLELRVQDGAGGPDHGH